MIFASREEAGRKLGQFLMSAGVQADLVLGLPRGGVVVAAEVAKILKRPLDVLVVRKIGHPIFREFAVGALAEEEVVLLDEAVLVRSHVDRADLEEVIVVETARLKAYREKFHHGKLGLKNKTALIVDDGLATGATTEAAVLSARKQGANKVIVSAPVASDTAVNRLAKVADEVKVLEVDPRFEAVGQYYRVFAQTTDEEVLSLLKSQRSSS